MTLTFASSQLAPGVVTDVIDLSQVASLVNRRFYRQGLNWAVAGIKVLSPGGFLGSIKVSKLPNTWILENKKKKSLATWTRMNNEALAETESLRPRFLDFKIYADAAHHAAGYGANLLPGTSFGLFTPGEWESSKVVMPDFDSAADEPARFSREVIAVGASYPGVGASGFDAVSMIEGYASSRLLPNVVDPNTPADASDADGTTPENWMTAIFNDGQITDSAIIEDLTTENNLAPYPFENDGVAIDTMYPGGANQGVGLQIHDIEYITTSTIGGTSRLKGGNFPCGLVALEITNTTGEIYQNVSIIIDLIPGRHRGYLAESMQEM